MTDATNNGEKTQLRGRPFAPGNPGGPGRPEGSRNKATLMLDQLADGEAEPILQQVMAQARDGDLKAAELVLSRAWPARKGRRVRFDLPAVNTAADVARAISALIEVTGRGDLTPDEAAIVAGLLEARRKAIETVELEDRLSKLEGMQQDKI